MLRLRPLRFATVGTVCGVGSLTFAILASVWLGVGAFGESTSPPPTGVAGADSAVAAAAASAGVGASLDLYPTFHCLGVRVSDVDGQLAAHRLEYRRTGEAGWREGHPLTPLPGGRLVGSIFSLTPGTEYEVQVTLTPKEGAAVVRSGSVRTRSEHFPSARGHTYYVSPEGDDEAEGSREHPFKTIQHAAEQVEPGDVVAVLPGTYREQVVIGRSGRPDAYITFRPEGEGVFLTGTDPAFEQQGQDRWEALGNGLYVTPFPAQTGFVAAEGKRLYHYPNRVELEELANGEPGGWYLSEPTGKLYVKLADGSDPDDHVLQVGRLDGVFLVRGAKYVVIEGFRMGYFGAGPYGVAVHLRDASNCVIRNNTIFCVRAGVAIDGPKACDNLVEGNHVYDTSITGWPWRANKGHDTEGSGISVRGYRGNVVRRNRVHGYFNAITSSMWGQLDEEGRNAGLDFYENDMWDIGDDCLEPEGACINNRFWGNRMYDCLMGVSLAPIRVGPAYVFRNVVYRYQSSGIKYSVDSFGACYIYHNVCYTDRPNHNALSAHGPWDNHHYRNNIFRGTRYAMEDTSRSTSGATADHNCFFTTNPDIYVKWANVRYDSREQWVKARGFEKHGISVEPGFVDPASGDFHLKPDSPCIDAGVRIPNINDDFTGRAPDMGCFEFTPR